MSGPLIEVQAIARVVGGRVEPTDDYWGGTAAIIRIDETLFGADATYGLEEFSHLEVVFHFHLMDKTDLPSGVRRPRNDARWPELGVFAHRNMRRLNWLAVSRCRLVRVDGLDLHVEDLDAIDGTPVVDIKPWFNEFAPRGAVRQPSWPTEMLTNYYAPASR
ncbi:SAM-dependent methyltransferase [Kribbella sp. NBC_01505]|uniref:SAM-dependent methyltransferase n=1 Tax=Kribbella sp. NBC_01505 TaxID=2903580 RepID=UPI00386F216E